MSETSTGTSSVGAARANAFYRLRWGVLLEHEPRERDEHWNFERRRGQLQIARMSLTALEHELEPQLADRQPAHPQPARQAIQHPAQQEPQPFEVVDPVLGLGALLEAQHDGRGTERLEILPARAPGELYAFLAEPCSERSPGQLRELPEGAHAPAPEPVDLQLWWIEQVERQRIQEGGHLLMLHDPSTSAVSRCQLRHRPRRSDSEPCLLETHVGKPRLESGQQAPLRREQHLRPVEIEKRHPPARLLHPRSDRARNVEQRLLRGANALQRERAHLQVRLHGLRLGHRHPPHPARHDRRALAPDVDPVAYRSDVLAEVRKIFSNIEEESLLVVRLQKEEKTAAGKHRWIIKDPAPNMRVPANG